MDKISIQQTLPIHKWDKSPLFLSAKAIVLTLQSKNYEAYFVGGVVRDMLLERPVSEIDIATSARPEEIMALFPDHKSVGAHFGVILVTIQKYTFDVASFRKDGQYIDGRRPISVSFTDAQEDAQRRDLTINGLFYNPETETIIDFVNGLEDLKNRNISPIGKPEERFQEDKLRMLRCIRFLTQLKPWGFKIPLAVLNTIKQQSSTIKVVSQERVREEIIKIISSAQNEQELLLLFQTGLAKYIFSKEHLSEKEVKCFLALVSTQIPFCWKYFTLLSDNFMIDLKLSQINKDFLFTKNEQEAFDSIQKWIKVIISWEETPIYQKKRLFRNPYIENTLLFLSIWIPQYQEEKLPIYQKIQHTYLLEKNNLYPPKWITGKTLIQVGLIPSPLFKEILEEIENQQLNGNIQTHHEALLYLQEILKKNKETDY